ncbi:hypothetical protein [Nocardia sp. NBC_01329]|uniref:hypothetical protein n=1 Tax=Nocardia sp. NBC_01329 TaxID=2903594 RepID=UPI002E139185|nr:hypothetical protein OG405_18300 [Nocardia sp. NBC_01329]
MNPSEQNPRLRYVYDRDTGYEAELRLTAALSALVPTDDLVHPDHRLFQIAHLVTEYSWVAIHHTLCDIATDLERDDTVPALRLIRRAKQLAAWPVNSIRLLIDSLPQASFLQMRAGFPEGSSGLDSPGARAVRKAAHVVWEVFEKTLVDHNLSFPELMPATRPGYSGDPGAALLSEVAMELHRFDSVMVEWKQVHLNMVWQLLGGHPGVSEDTAAPSDRPTSMRGRPLADLERLAVRPLFPRLWQESTAMYRSFGGDTDLAYRYRHDTSKEIQ